MLRIYRKGSADKFEFRRVDRRQAKDLIASFLAQWGHEFAEPAAELLDSRTGDPTNRGAGQAKAAVRRIPRDQFVAEWQDGDGDWDESAPTETIPVG